MTQRPPIGIIAAAGEIPVKAATALQAEGRDVYIIALKGIADADFSSFQHQQIRIGAVSEILASLKAQGCRDVLLSGKLARPSMASIFPDAKASKILLSLLSSGDNSALEVIRDIFAEEGMQIGDTSALLAGQRAGEGILAAGTNVDGMGESIATGKAVLAAMAGLDVGQAVVIQGRRVIAIEAAEGTDAMLARSKALVDPDLMPAIMVKMMKPDQNPLLDPPVIGSATVVKAAEAGILCIAVEAGSVLIADPEETLAAAEHAGVMIIGVQR